MFSQIEVGNTPRLIKRFRVLYSQRNVLQLSCCGAFCYMWLQYGRQFPEDIFKRISLNENVDFFIKISRKYVPSGLFNNIPALVQIRGWRRTGDKPLSVPMMAWFTDAYMRHSPSMNQRKLVWIYIMITWPPPKIWIRVSYESTKIDNLIKREKTLNKTVWLCHGN